jgi:hypothetical protein
MAFRNEVRIYEAVLFNEEKAEGVCVKEGRPGKVSLFSLFSIYSESQFSIRLQLH